MKPLKTIFLASLLAMAASASAQQTYEELELLTVNENVTTVITATEPVKFVDISTDMVDGDQPMENTVRLKPKDSSHLDGDILGIVTIVTERYRVQYGLIYTALMNEAVSDKEVQRREQTAYRNPAVTMPTEDMYLFARKIWNSPAKIRNVSNRGNRMVMRLNNVYSVGDYFFLDFSVENSTNIRFDIDELRVKLCDKKVGKTTNSQVIELKPEMTLEKARSFDHGFRNVIAVRKMTFPNDKILTLELTEKQISGRTISLSIDYEDVLAADCFDKYLLKED